MITLVNKSTLVSNSDVSLMARACAAQIRFHVAPEWRRQVMPVIYAIDENSAPPGSWIIGVLDDPDQADALGWHTEENGKYFGKVFAKPVLDNGGDSLTKNLSVSSVASHEVLEIFIDPACNRWASSSDGSYAISEEICDPVESVSYPINVGNKKIMVSDFVTERWFDSQASGPYDLLGQCQQPFEVLPGGYVVKLEAGQVSQVFGDEYPEWKKELKQHPLSRAARIAARVG